MDNMEQCVDPHNIKRGLCLNDDCDCAGYIRAENKIPCSYCLCPPAKHQRLEDGSTGSQKIFPISESTSVEVLGVEEALARYSSLPFNFNGTMKLKDPVSTFTLEPMEHVETTLDNAAGEENHHELPNIQQQKSTENKDEADRSIITENNSAHASTSNQQNDKNEANRQNNIINGQSSSAITKQKIFDCFPFAWPDYIQRIIKGEAKLTSNIRCEIIRTIVQGMMLRNLNHDTDYIDAAEQLLLRIPSLRTQSSHSSAVLIAEMKKCYKNKKQYEKKRCNKNLETEDIARTNDEILQNMKTEMLKEKPSIYSLKKDLDSCRSKRQADSKKAVSALDHLENYPALKIPDLVQYEFESLIGLTKTEIMKNWKLALPSLISFFLSKLKDVNSLNDDQSTTKILMKVEDHFKPRKVSETCTTRHIVQIFDEGTTVSTTEPKADEPPRMIGIGKNDLLNMKYSIYVDGSPMFNDTSVETLIHLFALYWVFNIEYASEARLAFTFISAVLFRKKVAKYYQKYKSVWNLIEELKLF